MVSITITISDKTTRQQMLVQKCERDILMRLIDARWVAGHLARVKSVR